MTDRLGQYPALRKTARWLWALVLLTLPVTSFRYYPSFLGRATVSPLALIPLLPLLLIFLWLMFRQRRIWWPPHSVALAAFLLFAMLATALGFMDTPFTLRGQDYDSRALRAWLSLGMGLAFFLAAVLMNRDEADLRFSLKWLYIGLFLTIVWGGVQALAINTPILDRSLIDSWQEIFSRRGLVARRISGFAYEPSWLADQMVILYLPWLYAAALSGFRLTRFKWLEPFLILAVGALLLLTFSRSGLLNAVLVAGVVLLFTARSWGQRAWAWFRTQSYAVRGSLTGLLLLSLVAAFSWLSQYDYFARLWDFDVENGLVGYVVNISAGPRLAYSMAALETYAEHPWTGVGLGATGFYIYDRLPAWSLTTVPEIARQLNPDSNIFPNAKNLYARLLAEVGLIGFWLFIAFYFSLLGSVRKLWVQARPHLRYAAMAALFIWLAVALRNGTQDSLTFPVMWTALGIVLGLSQAADVREPDAEQ
ncbi:MAG: O-antigen ligase domain-containing protein [Chloroflexi bacterium]|nr:MAG: O-antigen ligase domain-containing protein [Chloroflexota bacterium]MBL1194315.1 O-antigen ligase domain-containing protein [Chloroflexota bacterium]NOH11605.1 O-antigen ligase family protein [Chloroflexota bacterium]